MNIRNTTILHDQCIPFIDESFALHATCIPYEAGKLTREQLMQADVLLVRSVTRVDNALLEGTPIRYVGSVTAGMDHVDTQALDALGIAWAHAPGANAQAVAEYVGSVLAYLSQQDLLSGERHFGLIGCGEVGRRVKQLVTAMGWQVHVYDPPKSERETNVNSESWEDVIGCSVLCCCVPLTRTAAWPTEKMINADTLAALPEGAIVINVGRGGVLDESACLAQDRIRWCCDVWQNEPSINGAMVQRALLSTPHIAGYSQQAKRALTWRVYESLAKHMSWQLTGSLSQHQDKTSFPTEDKIILAHYNPVADHQAMQQAVCDNMAPVFRHLRSSYVYRLEYCKE